MAISAFTGALSGALASTGVGLVGQMIGGGTIAMAGNAIQQGIDIAQGEQEVFKFGAMFADGAIGVVAGFVGGDGASHGNSKTAMTLGKQLSKRIWRTREVSKAFAYYSKNMMNGARESIYKVMCKGILKSNGSSILINIGRSVYG